MEQSLIIATTNHYRKNVIISIIKKFFPYIIIDNKRINRRNISPESNKKAKDNAIEKVKFYGAFFKNNVLCEDDTLIIRGKETSPNRDGNRIRSKFEIYRYWEKFLEENGSVNAKIIKAFALYVQNKVQVNQIEFEVRMQLPKKKPNKIIVNPLNYFIVPKGYSKSLSDFSDIELNLYRKKEVLLLKNLLINTFGTNK